MKKMMNVFVKREESKFTYHPERRKGRMKSNLLKTVRHLLWVVPSVLVRNAAYLLWGALSILSKSIYHQLRGVIQKAEGLKGLKGENALGGRANRARTRRERRKDLLTPRQQETVMGKVITYMTENFDLRFNVISRQTEYRPKGETNAPFELVDNRVLNTICTDLQLEGVNSWDRDLRRYVDSTKVMPYHPIRQYMDELPAWDGVDRVTELAQRVSDDGVWVRHFHRWMLGMAAQWSGQMGLHANSVAPVLVSREQGMMKSTFCKSLLPSPLRAYYLDEFQISTASAERGVQKLGEMALINLDEFDKYSEGRMPLLKTLMQKNDLNMRRTFDRCSRVLPRVASFIATTNRIDVLTDLSGSRRFICVEVKGKINCEDIDHAQIYAQLKAELARGERSWFSTEEEQELQERNKQFYRIPPALDLFMKHFRPANEGEKCTEMSLSEIEEVLHEKNPAIMRSANLARLGQALIAIGCRRVHRERRNVYMVVRNQV